MRYLVDGYNLLHVLGLPAKVGPAGMERARRGLLDRVAAGLKGHDVTVVFDARRVPRGWRAEDVHEGIRVLFAVGHAEADDLLEVLIRQEHVPRHVVVVSDDLRVRQAGRRHGCALAGCEEFLRQLERPRTRRPGRPAPDDGKPAAPSDAETQAWLRAFADLADDPALDELYDPDGFLRGEADETP